MRDCNCKGKKWTKKKGEQRSGEGDVEESIIIKKGRKGADARSEIDGGEREELTAKERGKRKRGPEKTLL